MRLLPDDPRLTAYALGELDAADRASLEAALKDSPDARAELEAIRQTATLLGDELRTESAPTLTAAQRAAIVAGRNGQTELAPKLGSRTRIFLGFASLAACVLVAVGLSWPQRPLELKEWAISHNTAKPNSAPTLAPVPPPTQIAGNEPRDTKDRELLLPITATGELVPQSVRQRSVREAKKEDAERQAGGAPEQSGRMFDAFKEMTTPAPPFVTNVGSIVGQPTADPLVTAPSNSTNPASVALGNKNDGIPWHHDLQYPRSFDEIEAARAVRASGSAQDASIDQSNALRALSVELEKAKLGRRQIYGGQLPVSTPIAGSLGGSLGGRSEREKQDRAFYRRSDPNEPQPSPAARACSMPATVNTESYNPITDNPFLRVTDSPLSTFSIDVDTASYANIRRFITSGHLPPADAVRIEEMVNYFSYDYPQPTGDAPFSVNAEMAECPWAPRHRLLRIGLRGKSIAQDRQPATNLVFLVDVSGSMQPENKLPLLQKSLSMLVRKLNANDRVAIVVYAGASGLVLPSTSGDHQDTILAAIDRLNAGGSTNGAAGIQLAYETARANFIQGGANRVILATDGDFNVGITSEGDLARLIEEQAKSGIFLSVLGFGMDNLKDSTLETLADKGNGNYAYIDTPREARKALVEQLAGTLFTIAKDVKIQIEFNPARVGAYRLIGYENRILAAQDFNDDRKDAGEIGAGHTVTALYEIVPVGESINAPGIDPLKYQQPQAVAVAPGGAVNASNETCTVKLRYKQPDGQTSRLLEVPVIDLGNKFAAASTDFKFAAAVAGFGMQLRQSPFKGDWTLAAVQEVAQESRGNDITEYRSEFIDLVKKAKGLMGQAGG